MLINFGPIGENYDEGTKIYFIFEGKTNINGIELFSGRGAVISSATTAFGDAVGAIIFLETPESAELFDGAVFDFQPSEGFRSDLFHFSSRDLKGESEAYVKGIIGLITSDIKLLKGKTYDNPIEKHVLLAENYIKSNLNKKLLIEDVAKAVGVSRAYLRNIFFELRGVSPQEFLSDERIKKAKELLDSSNLGISEIAACVGYDDPLAFSKFFKKHVGVSPKNYRSPTREIKIENTTPDVKKEKFEVKSHVNDIKTYDNNINTSVEDITLEIEKAIALAVQAENDKSKETADPNSPVWML